MKGSHGWLAAALVLGGGPASAQTAPDAAPAAAAQAGDIVVTATRRATRIADVPVAITAVSADALRDSGATDIRGLTQLVPSLLVSSSSSEGAGGGARIRGIGTVGDNAGLESSVATFVDGVYRSRAAVALTELGPVERIEVLRGPQGTLFGRNASAGLISITTAAPSDRFGGYAEGSYGNYDYARLAAGVTGPIGRSGVAYRLDGVYTRRDGFVKDVISGRRINNRDRYLLRGKLRYAPSDRLSVLLIGDYAYRNEECCAGSYLPAVDRTRRVDGGFTVAPSSIAAIERGFVSAVPGVGRGIVDDDTDARRTALTPGRTLRSDVRDWGGSAQIDWDLGGAKLTSITAFRGNTFTSGQDADFGSLDLIVRDDDGGRFNRFRTFTQELRAQGSLFAGTLDWLLGGYYAHEALTVADNLSYGADFDRYAGAVAASALAAGNPVASGLLAQTGLGNLNSFARAYATAQLAGLPAAQRSGLADAIAAQVQDTTLAGTGDRDRFRQTDQTYALFTHDIVHLTDRLALTVGARHTWDRKSLDATLVSSSPCGTYNANIARLQALAASGALGASSSVASGLANGVLAPFAGFACVVNSVNGRFSGKRRESEWTGTASLSWKATDRLMLYGSASRGYKAGGFNLDRAPFYSPATRSAVATTNLAMLQFAPEKVDAFEIGTKFRGRGFDLNLAGFYQRFRNFQLNTFNGTAFFVTSVNGCTDDLGGTDSDAVAGNSPCGDTEAGVTSKGVEAEVYLYPAANLTASAGLTYADTRFAKDLVGTPDASGNNSLPPALSLLPGGRLSQSSEYAVIGSMQWTPPIGRLRGLLYADFRYTSAINTGSDLFAEKLQPAVMTVNARLGLGTADGGWSAEAWVRNAFDVTYIQTAFSEPLQGSNTSAAQLATGGRTTQLFGAFLAEPRTFGLTVRKTF